MINIRLALIVIGILFDLCSRRLAIVAPTSAINYQPANIQSRQFYFSNINGIPVPANNGPDHRSFYPVTFDRIQNILPHNYKIALCLTGVFYQVPLKSAVDNVNAARIYFQVSNVNASGFQMKLNLEVVTRLHFAKSRYLAVNYADDTLFYFEEVSRFVLSDLSSTPFVLTTNYMTAAPHTDHTTIQLLRGLNIAKATNSLMRISVGLGFPAANIQVRVQGQNVFLRNLHVTIIYYKNSLIYNHPSSQMVHTQILPLENLNCIAATTGYGQCISYDTSTPLNKFNMFHTNYIFGVEALECPVHLQYSVQFEKTTLNMLIPINTKLKLRGILFYSLECPDGFYVKTPQLICARCEKYCLRCGVSQCFQCENNYEVDTNMISCKLAVTLPSSFDGCIYFQEINGYFKCIFCDQIRKLSTSSLIIGCQCKMGYKLNTVSNVCEQICGDGLIFDSKCDDANLMDNDGCSSSCQLQEGFSCDISTTQTICQSTQQLTYQIHQIIKDQSEPGKTTIILKPINKFLPFQIFYSHFVSSNGSITDLSFLVILQSFPVEKTIQLNYELLKIENNLIYLVFSYDFTVENLNANIKLNYQKTRYLKNSQTLTFTLKGSNYPLNFSGYFSQYNIISKNILITVIISMLGLLAGLFVPKFIGLEIIITMQLIYYSQLLIVDYKQWPQGFTQFIHLKAATGYNQILQITDYTPLDNLSTKFQRLAIHKSVIQNLNISVVMLVFFAIFFYLTSLIINYKQVLLLNQIQSTKTNEFQAKSIQKQTYKSYNTVKKIHQILYWMTTQLSFWLILPLGSSIAAQMLISNDLVYFTDTNQIQSWLLNFRGVEVLIIFAIVFSIGLNLFFNIFLSIKTIRKMDERPQELLYKKLLFIYLFVMALLIFFFNHLRIAQLIPVSVICLIIHLGFTIALPIIKPYKQSLRIHAIALYMNQGLYLVFLGIINLINFVQQIDELITLCLGYFVTGIVWFLIILTVFRLYFEIRYGEALEKKIQKERKKVKEEEKRRKEEQLREKINKFENQAKQRITLKQKQRDMNKYLMDTQVKEEEKQNLISWLQGKNWDQQIKQQYYFKKFYQKPLEWIKQNDMEEYKKKLEEKQAVFKAQANKIDRVNSNPDYKEVVAKLRSEFQEKKKKKLLRSNNLQAI